MSAHTMHQNRSEINYHLHHLILTQGTTGRPHKPHPKHTNPPRGLIVKGFTGSAKGLKGFRTRSLRALRPFHLHYPCFSPYLPYGTPGGRPLPDCHMAHYSRLSGGGAHSLKVPNLRRTCFSVHFCLFTAIFL